MKIFNFKNGFIKNSSKLGLICQTHNTYYENKITSNKANIKKKNFEAQFQTKPMLDDKKEKEKLIKDKKRA